jgi:hypothetical protein
VTRTRVEDVPSLDGGASISFQMEMALGLFIGTLHEFCDYFNLNDDVMSRQKYSSKRSK